MTDAGRMLANLARRDSTVLLLDEERDTRVIAQDFFRDLGCRVISAADLVSAAHVLRSVEVDLIIARYEDTRAQSVAAALRACAGEVPIIALSAGTGSLRVLLHALGRALEKAEGYTSLN